MRALLALIALTGATAADEARELRFVACPIYRDTDAGRKSGCWLVDDAASGIRYDVTSAPTKPDWDHAVLVEGRRTANAGDPCGGTVLEPARVSVLEEPCTRFLLEAERYQGRRFALPTRNVRPLYEERTRPGRPYAARRIVLPFDFGSHFVTYQLTDYYLDAAINYALDVAPARILVTGYAASGPTTVSGRKLAEPASLARERADVVVRALTMRGVPADRIRAATSDRPEPIADEAFDGLAAPSLRRVEVRIEPDGGDANARAEIDYKGDVRSP